MGTLQREDVRAEGSEEEEIVIGEEWSSSVDSSQRAFGWPTGTVRAIMSLGILGTYMVGVTALYLLKTAGEAGDFSAILAGPVGLVMGLYFGARNKDER